MLPKQFSLRNKKEIARVARHGRSVFLPFLGIKVVRNHLSHPRVVVIVSTKVTKKATLRNKKRRQIRAALYHTFKNISPGFDIMVIARPLLVEKEYNEIRDAVEYALSRVGVIKKPFNGDMLPQKKKKRSV